MQHDKGPAIWGRAFGLYLSICIAFRLRTGAQGRFRPEYRQSHKDC